LRKAYKALYLKEQAKVKKLKNSLNMARKLIAELTSNKSSVARTIEYWKEQAGYYKTAMRGLERGVRQPNENDWSDVTL
jgi:hypothetical protein